MVDAHFSLFVLLLQEEDGYTGLHHAAKLGNLEIVTMLLETGQVDVNAQVKEGPTCHLSSFKQSVLLEEHHSDVILPGWSGSGQWRLDADHLGCGAQTR